MRKIIVAFSSSSKVQKLKKIMKEVYASQVNDPAKLTKFNLNKQIIPANVEEAEIEINKIIGSNVKVVIPRSSLTFLSAQPPFAIVENTSKDEGQYIVLPWSVRTVKDREELKSLINKISAASSSLKYTLSINADGAAGEPGIDDPSAASVNFSTGSFNDNMEELFNRIRELEAKVRLLEQQLASSTAEADRQQNLLQQKEAQITNLNNQLSSLRSSNSSQASQINNLNNRIRELSSNQVTWDQRVKNQTTLDFVGFTGKVVAVINPATNSFSVNVY